MNSIYVLCLRGRHIYHLIACQILHLTIYFVFKRILSIFHIIEKFLVGAHRFAVPFPKPQTFSEIFLALHIDYSQHGKKILGIFIYCLLRSNNDKSKFLFLETVQSSRNMSYLRTSHFCAKC